MIARLHLGFLWSKLKECQNAGTILTNKILSYKSSAAQKINMKTILIFMSRLKSDPELSPRELPA